MKNVCLGKREVKNDPRTIMLKDFLRTDATPLPPKKTNWRVKTGTLAMLLNDSIGDCGPAGFLHEIQSWINCDGGSFVPTDEMAQKAYIDLTGMNGPPYDPTTGANDNGVYLLDQCNYAIKVGMGGHRLGAYAKLNLADHGQVMDVTNLFDGLGAGWALPRAYQGAKVWKAPPRSGARGMWQPGSWGGHYGPIVDYDEKGVYIMTWGGIIFCEWGAYDVYGDEQYAYFSPDWFGEDLTAPNGFDWTGMASAFKDVTGKPAPISPGPSPSGKTTITISGPPWEMKVT